MTALIIYLAVLLVLLLARGLLGTFWAAAAFVIATITFLELGFHPGIPSSVKVEYIAVMLVAVLLYVTSSDAGWNDFFRPLISVATDERRFVLRWALLVAIPLLVAWQAHRSSLPSAVPPPKIRSVHPSPPNTITTQPPGQNDPHIVDLIRDTNPLRQLETSDPKKFAEHVARGRVVYYENCFYCHGDTMSADGHYATALRPTPANFQDPGTIAMLQEAYLYWRISKGGPGLPEAGTPWDSSMPVWEKMLSEEDMWSAILYLYDYVGYRPRGSEAHQ